MSILLVEPNEALRNVFKISLELYEYSVYDAATVSEALALLQERPVTVDEAVDLVISDLVMPDMNALELYEAVQALHQDVKMLIVTDYPMPHAGMSLVERTGVRWTGKPIRMDQLAEMVRAMLDGDSRPG